MLVSFLSMAPESRRFLEKRLGRLEPVDDDASDAMGEFHRSFQKLMASSSHAFHSAHRAASGHEPSRPKKSDTRKVVRTSLRVTTRWNERSSIGSMAMLGVERSMYSTALLFCLAGLLLPLPLLWPALVPLVAFVPLPLPLPLAVEDDDDDDDEAAVVLSDESERLLKSGGGATPSALGGEVPGEPMGERRFVGLTRLELPVGTEAESDGVDDELPAACRSDVGGDELMSVDDDAAADGDDDRNNDSFELLDDEDDEDDEPGLTWSTNSTDGKKNNNSTYGQPLPRYDDMSLWVVGSILEMLARALRCRVASVSSCLSALRSAGWSERMVLSRSFMVARYVPPIPTRPP